jgi:hypothetical protein
MDWKLYDSNGEFLQEVNCQYDALDLATLLYEAVEVEVDFINKKAIIKAKGLLP